MIYYVASVIVLSLIQFKFGALGIIGTLLAVIPRVAFVVRKVGIVYPIKTIMKLEVLPYVFVVIRFFIFRDSFTVINSLVTVFMSLLILFVYYLDFMFYVYVEQEDID